MKASTLILVAAGAAMSSLVAFAQPAATAEPATKAPPVYHAGGRHDQKLHEAALRARADGQRMEATMHAGGRHDARVHEAAIKAEATRGSRDAAR
jgi:Spy/CpxP family protein refolding chaperone